MKFFRFSLLFILFLGMVAAGLLTQVIIGTECSVLRADFYQAQFARHNIYDLSQRYVHLRIKEGLNNQLSESVAKALLAASEDAFSAQWSQEQSTRLIANFLGYVTGTNDQLLLAIDLKSRKTILEQDFVLAIKDTAASSQLASILETLPPEVTDGKIGRLLPLPDTLDLAQSSFFQQSTVQDYMHFTRGHYSMMRYVPILLFLFLAGWILAAGWSSGIKWFGLSIALSSIIFMVLISAGSGILDRYIILHTSGQDHLLTALGTNPLVLAMILRDAIVAVYFRVGVIVGISGAFMGLIGFWCGKRETVLEDASSTPT